jgi:uncharacterized membrane protein YgcG
LLKNGRNYPFFDSLQGSGCPYEPIDDLNLIRGYILAIVNFFCSSNFANSFIKCCDQLKYMVTFKDRSFAAKSPGILILAILSMVWISSQVGTVHGIPTTNTPFVVKITSPHKGQQVGIGHNVTLLGSSNYNASSKCQVSVIVDKKRPYQNTIPIGQGVDNYSQWKYTLAPTYTALTEGVNRVTAKLTCDANPALTKSYSINLTGVNQPPATSQPSQRQIAIKSNGTTSQFLPPSSLSSASAPSNSTLAPSNSTLAPSNSTLAPSNRTNTTSVIPVSANSSSLIDPPSTHSSSSSSSGHSHIHHHSHHTHHHSSSSGSSSSSSEHHHSSSSGSSSSSSEHHHSSSSNSHRHSGSENHNNGNGGHSSGGGGGHDFFHGAFSHFGQ